MADRIKKSSGGRKQVGPGEHFWKFLSEKSEVYYVYKDEYLWQADV